MIINIRITEAALERMKDATGYDEETALEALQDCINLCDKSGSLGPEVRNREKELADSLWEAYSTLANNGINPAFYPTLSEAIEALAGRPGAWLRRAAQKVIETAFPYSPGALPWDLFHSITGLRSALRNAGEDVSQISRDLDIEYISELASRIVIDTLKARYEPGTLSFSDSVIKYEVKSRIEEALRARDISQAPEKDPPLISREKLDSMLWESHVALVKAGANPSYASTEEAINQIIEKAIARHKREGERGEDRLYKTARALLDYLDEAGPDAFRSRFGMSPALETCRRIITEGEGNPHPWEGVADE